MHQRHKILLASAIMTLAPWAYAQTPSSVAPEPPTPVPPTAAPPDTAPVPGVTPPDVPPVAPATPVQPQPDTTSQPQSGAIVMPPAAEHSVTVERRAQTETDTDPYIQRRIARKEAKADYRQAKREARQEYRDAKRAADERFYAMRREDNAQSPRGERSADHLGNDYYGSTGQ